MENLTVWVLFADGACEVMARGVDSETADDMARRLRASGLPWNSVAILPGFVAADSYTPRQFRGLAFSRCR